MGEGVNVHCWNIYLCVYKTLNASLHPLFVWWSDICVEYKEDAGREVLHSTPFTFNQNET